ncbi:MAG: FHA domain-containing protein [Acidobacteria bacterium]|jgi:pSer/pThr/pTyr-binding forkhead associated (FHA) protein|nr:FHA domain-containing protein [Acidobacteriota bacterium]
MTLKSFIGKIFGEDTQIGLEYEPESVKHEISFKDTVVEMVVRDIDENVNDSGYEIDIFMEDEKSRSYKLTTDTRIGRDPSQTDISISELIVSKFHCTIYFKDGDVFIKDNNSTNGTYVNGKKITDQKLQDNDLITLGKKGIVRIVFHKKEEQSNEKD